MKFSALLVSFITLILTTGTTTAELSNNEQYPEQYIEKLDKISYLPRLLPVIIENSDVIELTNKQLNSLLAWRKTNGKNLITAMNEIAHRRIEIKEAALSPNVSSARLIQMQNNVFRLQREMLEYKLSCRELVINTFNRNNWEGFFLVLADKQIGVTLPEIYISKR
ncbi:MAG: hypothetical protein DRQ40_10915 [Gammaproteobacteria bacterium]|nr:MAG: hypothetical protein DRQ40_10915 [Gammaproteobacteria bacterium]